MTVLMGLSLAVAYALGTGEWNQVARRATTKDLALLKQILEWQAGG